MAAAEYTSGTFNRINSLRRRIILAEGDDKTNARDVLAGYRREGNSSFGEYRKVRRRVDKVALRADLSERQRDRECARARVRANLLDGKYVSSGTESIYSPFEQP